MKPLCILVLFQLLFLTQIRVETEHRSKYKVDFNFIFISIEKKYFVNILIFFEENLETNQNLKPHVL